LRHNAHVLRFTVLTAPSVTPKGKLSSTKKDSKLMENLGYFDENGVF
jgi:hypothetical protein